MHARSLLYHLLAAFLGAAWWLLVSVGLVTLEVPILTWSDAAGLLVPAVLGSWIAAVSMKRRIVALEGWTRSFPTGAAALLVGVVIATATWVVMEFLADSPPGFGAWIGALLELELLVLVYALIFAPLAIPIAACHVRLLAIAHSGAGR